MVLCGLLVDPFIHCRCQNVAIDDSYAAVSALIADKPICCSSGSSISSSEFGVSY